MRHVKYIGHSPTLSKGAKALMREDGKVQLDGPTGGWGDPSLLDPRCLGWHDLGSDWEDIQ